MVTAASPDVSSDPLARLLNEAIVRKGYVHGDGSPYIAAFAKAMTEAGWPVHKQTVAQWLRGQNRPVDGCRQLLARLLDIPILDLLMACAIEGERQEGDRKGRPRKVAVSNGA